MKLKFLLVNPWVCDFVAPSRWVMPLGLFKVAEHLSSFDSALDFIDCLGGSPAGAGSVRSERIGTPPLLRDVPFPYRRYGMSPDDFSASVRSALPVDAVLVTSSMSYWHPGVQQALEVIWREAPGVPVLLGGVYATLFHEHAARESGADFVYRGMAGRGIGAALRTFGFRMRRGKAERQPYRRLGLHRGNAFAPLLTGTGCALSCGSCVPSLMSPRPDNPEPEAVLREIRHIAGLGARDFVFHDDTLTADGGGRVKSLLRGVTEAGLCLRFHAPQGFDAALLDDELAGLLRLAGFRSVRLTLGTGDCRDKQAGTVSAELIRAVKCLRERGFTRDDIGVFLRYGLPGQSPGEVRDVLRCLSGLGVTVHLEGISPVRGTRLWSTLVAGGRLSDDADPLLTNPLVYAGLAGGYGWREIEELQIGARRGNPP